MSTPGVTAEESERLNGLWIIADRAGIHRCTANLEAAVAGYEAALERKREVKAEVDAAQADRDDAAGMARTDLARRIIREGTKTFVPDGVDGEKRQVTADEAKAWVERAVAAAQDVAVYEKPLAAARLRMEEVTDLIAVAERRIQAARYQTDSAVALTNLLSAAFKETTR